MTENTRALFDELFHVKFQNPFEIVDRDCPCEYSLQDYLAYATDGREVAVGYLLCSEPLTREQHEDVWPGLRFEPDNPGRRLYDIPLVYAPGVGIWITEPVFTSAPDAREHVRLCIGVVARRVGKPLDQLPIEVALVSVLDDVEPDLCGIDRNQFFETDLFSNVEDGLASRRTHDAEADEIEAVLRELLGGAEWADAKTSEYPMGITIPRWLVEKVKGVAAA